MNSFRIITLRSVFGTDQQTRQWMARARTVETRTEIRRWARWESVSFWLLLLGGICVFAAPVLGLASGIWSAFDDQAPPWLWFLFAPLGAAFILLLAGAWSGSYASDRRLTALYADGQSTVGRVDEVITHPGGGDEQTTYELLIGAELPDGTLLRRRLDWGEDNTSWPIPRRWVGRSIRFRHNTLDPDDLRDVRFDGWPDRNGSRS
ncbi:Uncharacterised protein [Mycobacteroides abscessus subsp. massiliense]|uniref:hypothetical protein n=1 Tax=Mycobacteroides abscessus TaxID=36809 RepID=UPI0009A8BED4|nr:hypothetical protein [Mycobacteroides abscessus]SKG73826.1 Uncharacterised protein [Mycobacteroides abscessus subsp. massiliense]SKH72713.1 Uncharacterised protein [Mycobacteroides abscessus subsp. massiliense]SKI55710.1 Uncharacterised protein [Mycobacteroides abscessus subsp. massiliense]SKI76504.1 Uncharacterised protein [Mycobacteroides abscessus subsp. massiliense]SKL31820.1 Uncharacterised protein [Mycobacteroides abscessus subsp. massiliense]